MHSTINDLVQWSIDGDRVILFPVTIDAIERGGVIGAHVERQVRQDIGLIAETIGRRLKVVSRSGELVARFASN